MDCKTLGTTDKLDGIAYGNSTYVTVGDDGIIFSSTDTNTWTSRTSGTSKHFRRVFYKE